jgi:DNA-binding transcriptional LysR family regulator
MRPSDFAELRAFAAVLRHGGFTRAAGHLGCSPSALSQTVRALEERLGTRLLNRTTRSVAPTEAGQRLAERLLPVLDDLDAVAAQAGPEGAPTGRLRINASTIAARHVLAPLVGPFLRLHPQVTLDIAVEDALVDIVAQGFDAGIRLGEALEADMIAVRLGPDLQMAVVASPDYLARHGTPSHPRDLSRHATLSLTYADGRPYRWEFGAEGAELRIPVQGLLVCNEPSVRLAAARDGLGIAYAFEVEARDLLATGELVRVLADWTPPFPGCHLYHPSRRHVPPPLRAFIDFAKAASGRRAPLPGAG